MKRRWAVLRWMCTAGLVLVVALWVLSRFKQFDRDVSYTWIVSLNSGMLSGTCYVGLPQLIAHHRGENFVLVGNASGVSSWRWPSYLSDAHFGSRTIDLPLWLPTLVLLLGTGGLWAAHLRTRRRKASGACARCGYALAGLPAGKMCPECGGSVGISKNEGV